MATFRAEDGISGSSGRAQVKIGDNLYDLFFAKKVEATVDKIKSEVKTLGSRAVQSKTTGWKGTGSMTLYYGTPVFRTAIAEYAKTGKDLYFSLIVENDDEASSFGKQSVILTDCNIDSVALAKLDVETEVLDEEVQFTFSGFEFTESFTTIT